MRSGRPKSPIFASHSLRHPSCGMCRSPSSPRATRSSQVKATAPAATRRRKRHREASAESTGKCWGQDPYNTRFNIKHDKTGGKDKVIFGDVHGGETTEYKPFRRLYVADPSGTSQPVRGGGLGSGARWHTDQLHHHRTALVRHPLGAASRRRIRPTARAATSPRKRPAEGPRSCAGPCWTTTAKRCPTSGSRSGGTRPADRIRSSGRTFATAASQAMCRTGSSTSATPQGRPAHFFVMAHPE
jgi:hypothetical protein